MNLHQLVANNDIPAIESLAHGKANIDGRNTNGETALMTAVANQKVSLATVQCLISNGADINAVAGAKSSHKGRSVLSIAISTGTLEKVEELVAAGADVTWSDPAGYTLVLRAVFRQLKEPEVDQRPLTEFLISRGAPLDSVSDHGESALSVASGHALFSLVKLLLDHGADAAPLGWDQLHQAVVFADLNEIRTIVGSGAVLEIRDAWDRTPFLLSLHAGRQDVAAFLYDCGSDLCTTGRCGMTAPMYVIPGDNAQLLRWLISAGADIAATDEFGNSALQQAAAAGAKGCVDVLLEAGASPNERDAYGEPLLKSVDDPEIIARLVAAGADLSDVTPSARARLTGGDFAAELTVTGSQYHAYKHRCFGKQNPERMNNSFWEEMIRTRKSAYSAGSQFGEPVLHQEPIWCFDRFGQSLTQLPDGRYVEIGGEHEDYYDPDFCIYNDVVVHHGDGKFDIFGYPAEVFPPTDFHTATLCGDYIYVIGCLGYAEQRRPGETPVYRLCCRTWRMEKVTPRGQPPGWIFEHATRLTSTNTVEISGGSVVSELDKEPVENDAIYLLNLDSLSWRLSPPVQPEQVDNHTSER